MPLTESEAYLTSLAKKSFLSMWSYANPGYGPASSTKKGKEFCDLLISFEKHVILFSDKQCEFPNSGNAVLDWKRWYRRAILSSSKQLIGAKRTLLRAPDLIHQDLSLTVPFPLELPRSDKARVFLVAVAHGSKDACQKEFDRSSLNLDTRVVADELPLTVGSMFRGHFVHVLDDATLETIFGELDTIRDFVEYLTEKESALATSEFVIAGEENLLAQYVTHRGQSGEHIIPVLAPITHVKQGEWEKYKASPRYHHSKEENLISYNIDRVIEHFTNSIESGEMVLGSDLPLAKHERSLRFLASESRFERRVIATALDQLLHESEINRFHASTISSPSQAKVRYVFVSYPEPPDGVEFEQWEDPILDYFSHHLVVARNAFADCEIVIGFCTPNPACKMRSYFMRILDGRVWTEEDRAEADHWQHVAGIFANMQEDKYLHVE